MNIEHSLAQVLTFRQILDPSTALQMPHLLLLYSEAAQMMAVVFGQYAGASHSGTRLLAGGCQLAIEPERADSACILSIDPICQYCLSLHECSRLLVSTY